MLTTSKVPAVHDRNLQMSASCLLRSLLHGAATSHYCASALKPCLHPIQVVNHICEAVVFTLIRDSLHPIRQVKELTHHCAA
ncbi:hypothetical protein NDU88_006000 [Pleurodeles waltl]|uniref:Secreted protein n=1 Tax=Pleurodeles waltl TaxID=8319 RepID=A0AAV7WWW2_PLEWA|nr:hypothetical protein NDU88_006000 [Pleurodeles waltl]